jgi:hypothetical protein
MERCLTPFHWDAQRAEWVLEGASPSDTVGSVSRDASLRQMEPEHLILPREGHVPWPQEERPPRSGST